MRGRLTAARALNPYLKIFTKSMQTCAQLIQLYINVTTGGRETHHGGLQTEKIISAIKNSVKKKHSFLYSMLNFSLYKKYHFLFLFFSSNKKINSSTKKKEITEE